MEKIRTCHDCGKLYQGPNAGKALAGHVWLKHHKRTGVRHELEAKVEQLQAALKASEDRVRVLEGELNCPKCGKPLSEHFCSKWG